MSFTKLFFFDIAKKNLPDLPTPSLPYPISGIHGPPPPCLPVSSSRKIENWTRVTPHRTQSFKSIANLFIAIIRLPNWGVYPLNWDEDWVTEWVSMVGDVSDFSGGSLYTSFGHWKSSISQPKNGQVKWVITYLQKSMLFTRLEATRKTEVPLKSSTSVSSRQILARIHGMHA